MHHRAMRSKVVFSKIILSKSDTGAGLHTGGIYCEPRLAAGIRQILQCGIPKKIGAIFFNQQLAEMFDRAEDSSENRTDVVLPP
jgi:hypothetical protein